MVIKCIGNKSEKAIYSYYFVSGNPAEKYFTIGKNYLVFGILIKNGTVYFNFFGDNEEPVFVPSQLFEIADSRMSRYFNLGVQNIDGSSRLAQYLNIGEIKNVGDKIVPFISFKEWVTNPDFFYNFINCCPDEVAIMEKYKELLYMEFKSPDIQQAAQILDNKWLMCPLCAESWEQKLDLEMCRCPKCKTILINPL